MTPEELKAIEARIRADDATAEDMRALLAYVKEDLLTKLETRLAAAEKVVEAAKATRALEKESGGFFAWYSHLDHALAEYDKLEEK